MLPADNKNKHRQILVNILKTIYLVTVFAVACLCFSILLNQGNTDLTRDMNDPTLPVIHMSRGGYDINYMYGYLAQMDTRLMRDNLTVIEADRKVKLVVDTYGETLRGMRFEVRSIDGTRLVEQTDIPFSGSSSGRIETDFTIKDLIEAGREYMLIILLDTDRHRDIRYYSRLLQSDGLHLEEKLAYVYDFSAKTFDREAARELTKYLESDSTGDNSSFMYADIHSSFKQVTWGDLAVSRMGTPRMTVSEITPATGYFRVDYQVNISDENINSICDVSEYYRIRYTSERMYLLSWERRLEQIPDEQSLAVQGDKISLGFADPGLALTESDGGNEFAFVSARKLIGVSLANKKINAIYSFHDDRYTDLRCIHKEHKIRILSVGETGDVEFMVYGYMNRGIHEGRVGICVYEYNSAYNTIEEVAYIDYSGSASILMGNVDELSYADREGHEYYMLERNVYKIDPEKRSLISVAGTLYDDSYKVSDSGQLLLWQVDGDVYNCEKLRLLNLATGISEDIKAGYAEYIYPIGFMGTDCVYGLAKSRDVHIDVDGSMVFPMYKIVIRDVSGEILKTYSNEGVYVMDCELADGYLTLHRAVMDESSKVLTPTDDDSIVRVTQTQGHDNNVSTVVTDIYETTVAISMKEELNSEEIIYLSPREVITEDRKDLIPEEHDRTNGYYVYGLNGFVSEYMEAANAVNSAYSRAGIVVNSEGEYVWYRTTRSGKNQIMAITEPEKREASESLAACIDEMLGYAGATTNSRILLNQGLTATQILERYMPDKSVLNLSGCNLDAVLYYVNMDIPVLAILNDQTSYLITGFNESQIVLYDPSNGELRKESITDMDNLFRSNAYRFITYSE